jgi:hypothetical protein
MMQLKRVGIGCINTPLNGRRKTMTLTQQIQIEVTKATAAFATSSSEQVSDLGKVAGIVSRQGRRGSDECAIAKAIAAEALAELRRRAA